MLPTGVIDLHCDTLVEWKYTSTGNPDTLDDPSRALALSKIPQGLKWAQCFAIFVPDEVRGADAIAFFERNLANFERQMQKFSSAVQPCRSFDDLNAAFDAGKTAAILTVESGAALAGKLERIQTLRDAGVRILTLTWNDENELGSGNATHHGLSQFGKEAVAELEKQNILIDVSHLNDRGMEDFLSIAKRPFLTTHSNARALAPSKRNLTDEQIRELASRGCLMGLNFYVEFLREDSDVRSLDDLYRHAMHFLELGAEHCLALGSDFDGAVLPECLNSCEKVPAILDYFLARGMAQKTADGILFGNAYRFFEKHLR